MSQQIKAETTNELLMECKNRNINSDKVATVLISRKFKVTNSVIEFPKHAEVRCEQVMSDNKFSVKLRNFWLQKNATDNYIQMTKAPS